MKYGLFLAVMIFLMATIVSANPYSFNLYDLPTFNNNTAFVNSTRFWITTSLGPLGDVASGQFKTLGDQTLYIDSDYIDANWCALTGCTMEGTFNMGGNDILMDGGNIDNVGDVNATSLTLEGDQTISSWDDPLVGTNISVNFGANESDYPNDIIPWRVSNEGVLQVEVEALANQFWFNDSGTINTTTNANYFIGGNLTVAKSINILSGESIHFDLGTAIATMSAQTFGLLPQNRTGIISDVDLGIIQPFNGTSYMSNINSDNNDNSNAVVSANSYTGHGMSLFKFNDNHERPQLGGIWNHLGDFHILSINDNTTTIRMGWANYTDVQDFSVTGFENETFPFIMTITETNISNILNLNNILNAKSINITENLNLNGEGNITNILSTVYNISGCTDATAGTLCHDADFDTLRYVTESGQVLQINQETTMPAKNTEGSNVVDGSVVYIIGATGGNPNFKLARADNLSTSGLMGGLTKDCVNNQVCPVIFFGMMHDIDTTSFSEGDHLYLSATEAGNLTTTPPEFPNIPVWIATAIRIHATEGSIFVFPRLDSANGITMNNLGLVGDFIQTDYKIRSLEGHENLNGKNVMCIEMNGTTGEDVCHVAFQPGGVGQASIWTRGMLVVPENLICLNNTNRTDAQCWADAGGFVWNITDFNTTNTEGADAGITGEFEVVKSVFIWQNLTVVNSIFSRFIGSITNRITKIWAFALDVDGNITATGNVTAENVWLPTMIFTHTNETIPLVSGGAWVNITFDQEEDSIKKRITHNTNDATNTTYTIQDDGIYEIKYTFVFQDSAPSPNGHIVTRVINNGIEIDGSLLEVDTTKQNSDTLIPHSSILVELEANDELKFQFTSDDTTVSMTAHLTFGEHKDTGVVTIRRIA